MARRARHHHAEWLSLVEVSGPFLSLPVLNRAFPQGLDADDPEHAARLRLAHQEWSEASREDLDRGLHVTWVRWVLRNTLGFPDDVILKADEGGGFRVRVAEHDEVLEPDLVVVEPEPTGGRRRARLLIQVVPAGQDLERALKGHHWKASPATRIADLLRGSADAAVSLGLVTNGEAWMLVHAPQGQPAGFVSWDATLWLEERLTLRAFRSLLGASRLLGVAENETLEAMLRESSQDQQTVTEELGLQVRKAVEVLVQTIDRIDREGGRTLLAQYDERRLYEAVVTVMMRLVFLLYAEERDLLPLSDPLYAESYAVSTLHASLQESADKHGEDVLERAHTAWGRLLATFRAVHGGIEHEALRLPAYGGGLFDPDRFPFLEGRAQATTWRTARAQPLPIDDRTVLHLLTSLQFLGVSDYGGGEQLRRLSFNALGVEEIGHVYESLLDHTALRADGPVLGLWGAKNLEPEVELERLEELEKQGRDSVIEYLAKETRRPKTAIENALEYEIPADETGRWMVRCGDSDLYDRVAPFAGLVREDMSEYPTVFPTHSLYVTQGSDRRSSGTYYTPTSLTEPIVEHALAALAFDGPSDGKSREQWKRRHPRDLLKLKTCDLAVGSGAFLVQTCRYLSERLVEGWEAIEAANPGRLVITPEGDLSNGRPNERPIPKDPDERLAIARRVVADRCLFGVDPNPMAVEMAKLSLWLVTLQKGKPFTFLDHALKMGDSLLGLSSVSQLEHFHLRPESGQQLPLFAKAAKEALEEAVAKRRQLESFVVNDVRDAEEKSRLLTEADSTLDVVRLAGDLIVGAALESARVRRPSYDDRLADLSAELNDAMQLTRETKRAEALQDLRARADRLLLSEDGTRIRRPLHWPIEFPEVFEGTAPGFDAFVGNPPFQGGQKITGTLGTDYRDFLVRWIASGARGSADLCAYMFLRAGELLRDGGHFGLLATNTIAQGDTREVGLDQLLARGFTIPRALSSQKWPGGANLEVSVVWARKGAWKGPSVLDDLEVKGISSHLAVPGKVRGKPYRLAANEGKSFQGSIVLGMGFVLEPSEAKALIKKDRRNKDVLFPYLNGEDLNSRWDQSPSRWVINFHDWPLDRSAKGSWARADEKQRKKWLREGRVPKDYSGPVAADYPDCSNVVARDVRPERATNKRRVRRERWWQFAERAPSLYQSIEGLNQVLVAVQTSKYLSISFQSPEMVFSHMTVVFALQSAGDFAVLNASWHSDWIRKYCSSLETRLRYIPTDGFETFPFPSSTATLDRVGQSYADTRMRVMVELKEGLTRVYNRVHDREDGSPLIESLRQRRLDLDTATAVAYGWSDLKLTHGFYRTPHGLRFTISPVQMKDILDRLLKLNHQLGSEDLAHDARDPVSRRRGTHQGMKALPLLVDGD